MNDSPVHETPNPGEMPERDAFASIRETPVYLSEVLEEQTLAQALGHLVRAPRATLQAMRRIAQAEVRAAERDQPPAAISAGAVPVPAPRPAAALESGRDRLDQHEAAQLGLRLSACIITLWGSGILVNSPIRTENLALDAGAPLLLAGFMLWLAAEVYGDWPALRARWPRSVQSSEETGRPAESASKSDNAASGSANYTLRILFGLGGLFFSLVAWRFTANNYFTVLGFWSWMLSMLLWTAAVAPQGWGVLPSLHWLVQTVRAVQWRQNWTVALLMLIMLLGGLFRLAELPAVPPEMTSDHVEKILDSQRTLDGQTQVFFPNNGGREPFQMYAMGLFSQLPGLGMNFTTLKLLTVIEGLIAILAMYWMGREVMSRGDPRLGRLVGIALAALVAASYWHTALSRLGLRIVLTTLVTALLLIFLARAMRDNRRGDFIKAGLVLGFGLYTYQAVRMLPVVVAAGVVIAFLFSIRRAADRGRMIINFAILILIAFAAFVPLFGFALQYPEDFLRRTSGRLLGDDIIQTTNEQGDIVQREATIQERLEAFNQNLPVLADNMRNALLMFNWKGDVAWINAAPNRPAMDMFTGSLLIVGAAAWLARIIRRRDPFDLLIPLAVIIMLLPSALSIAYPVENPSHTRTSGALPIVYLITALPLALILQSVMKLIKGRSGTAAASALGVFVVLAAYTSNASLYFNVYRASYLDSSLPYTEAGRILRGFAESDGALGNAFMIGYPYWWDHRAVGIEAGVTDWPNGIVSIGLLPTILRDNAQRDDRYRFDPDRDMLFFVAVEDLGSQAQLTSWFPDGRWQRRQSYQGDDDYMLFRVFALGQEAFEAWLARSL